MTRLPRNSARRSEDEGLGSFEPFSKGARPWEQHATELRQLAGVPDGDKLDPWQLAPKVGLLVLDGEQAFAHLSEEERAHLCGPAQGSWSGGVLPEPLPDGRRVCIINPRHNRQRNRITLMEEIVHRHRNHRPTKITLRENLFQVRDFDEKQEKEAYGVGAAALLPWSIFFRYLNQGTDVPHLAALFDVSEDLIIYRIKITGAYRLYLARQRRTA